MLILGLDVATVTGWAVYDTDRPPSAIVSGSIKLLGDTAFDRVCYMRKTLPRLIKEHRPDFSAIESPMEFAPAFKKKSKTMFGEEDQGTTINSKTIAVLNRYAGAAEMAVLGQNIPCVSVAAKTWQAIIPSQFKGKPKQRASAYCDMLKIVSPNIDSRDACIIAIWAAGHAQEFKLLQRERAA
jgi:Holliday junction resolvasome RuvABC endonuclease subunit